MKRAAPTILIVLLLLSGGAIVNVAVAWGLCRTPKWSTPHSKVSPQEGADQWWQANALETFPRDGELMEVMEWKRFANRYWAVSTYTHHADRFESGWPLYTLERSHWTHILQIYQHQHALPLAPRLSDWLGTDYLPLRPIWPGFAINTIFYGVILWGLMFGARQTRRTIRRRRGRCPNCAYPRGKSDVCTECGAALPGVSG